MSTEARDAITHGADRIQASFTFDRFVRGEGNRMACAACEAVARRPGTRYNPLFIHGDVGLGKTHLLHAVAQEAGQRSGANARYVTSERFAIDLIQAIRQGRTAEFRQVYRQADLLLLDDVHFIENKTTTEDELFHTFNALYEQGNQIVLSSDRPPEDLGHMPTRLTSRFQGGMVVGIQPPEFDVRRAILAAKAAAHGFDFEDEILQLIARHVTANVRVLEGTLISLAARADLCGQRLTVDQVAKLIDSDDVGAQRPLSVDLIKAEVAKHYGVDPTKLEGKARDKRTTQARQIAMYLARELTDTSYPGIGQSFGGRDHSTVMHACRRAEALLRTPLFRSDVAQLQDRLRRLQTYGKAS